MCLKNITRKVPFDERQRVRYGWKVFRVVEYVGIGPQFHAQYYGEVFHRVGRWIERDTRVRLQSDDGDVYMSGFHAFATKKAADDYRRGSYGARWLQTARVRLRGVHTEGTQHSQPDLFPVTVLVAKEMLILTKPKRRR
jgi:hypothetical protein